MDKPTHVMFAPIFTVGATFLMSTKAPDLIPSTPFFLNILVPTACSFVTAMAPDADLHAYKPMFVIWGKKNKYKRGNVYYLPIFENGKWVVKQYMTPRTTVSKIFATIFKKMNCDGHRGFVSHSPFLWVTFFAIIYSLVFRYLKIPILGTILSLVVLGLGCGYTSHLVGDMFTKGGLRWTPGSKSISPMNMIFGKIPLLKNLPKANNPLWTKSFIIVSVDVLLCILFPDFMIPINQKIWGTVVDAYKTVMPKLLAFIKNRG